MDFNKELAEQGYFVAKYEDRFFWDTPENLDLYKYGTRGGWQNYERNPVLGDEYGTCFDMSVIQDDGKFKMWFSWRPKACIAYTESRDGLAWSEPVEVLRPDPASSWDNDEENRPSVIKKDGKYLMWYSGQMNPYTNEGISVIGYAESDDGLHWIRNREPVMKPDQKWETKAIMCPHVLYEEDSNLFKMWYSGGGNHEPDAIGYAESRDGKIWNKPVQSAVLTPIPSNPWERSKVAACHVLKHDDWYYMFYIGFIHVDRASIGLARSRDGIRNWERHPENPLIAPLKGGWSDKAVYKPYVLKLTEKWIMWYNGAMYIPDDKELVIEQIGVAYLNRENLWS
jgi:beta-xylosidase